MKEKTKGLAFMFAGTFPQLLAVFVGTISAISDGMQYGWSAPIIPVLQKPDTPVKIQESDIIWLESIYMLGGICGLPITIYLVDKLGRHKTIIVSSITSLIAWIIIGVANRVEYVYLARILTGIGGDVAFVATPMYIAEIADQKIRGFLSSLIYLMMLVGILLIYSIGPFVPIYVSSIVGASFYVFQLMIFPFMPESPYFLLYKGKREKARRALNKLRTSSNNDLELASIHEAIERQKTERGRPQDLILVKSNRKALTIMLVLNAAQHFSSISVILMNLHLILKAAGSVYLDASTAAIIFAALMLIAATTASFCLDRFGRKILLTSSSLLTGLSLLCLAIYFNLKFLNYDVTHVSWIPIVSIMVYAVVFKIGLGVVPIVMTAEMFPARVKALGMTLSDGAYVLFAIISVLIYQKLTDAFGIHVPFYIFAASCLFTALFSALVLPETKGKTLEEIQMILKGLPPGGAQDKSLENGIKPPVDSKEIVTHM